MSDDRIFQGVGSSVGANPSGSGKCVPSPSACSGIDPFSGGCNILFVILIIFLILCLICSCGFGGFALSN